MIRTLGRIPAHCELACSGGVDSMAAHSFLTELKIPHSLLFFNHNTETSQKAHRFLTQRFGDKVISTQISRAKLKTQSWEEYWRTERQRFFKSRKAFVLTAHHLDDAAETWIWSSLHGQPKIPLYWNGAVYRPFLLTPKTDLVAWAKKRGVEWCEDQTNQDLNFQRNYVRHELIPKALQINPGLPKTIRKKILQQYKEKQNG